LSEAFANASRPLRVLVELGSPGGRTGCRTNQDALDVARAVIASPGLSLSGAAGFEGILGADRAPASVDAVDAFCDRLAEVGRALLESRGGGPSEFVVSAGGSAFPDRVIERLAPFAKDHPDVRVVIRSGCYVTHDDGFYDRVSPFSARATDPGTPHLRPALELWGAVLSRPEPGLAVLGFGKRDAPFDLGLPVPHVVRSRVGGAPRKAVSMTVTRLNDQHAYLALSPDDPLEPGDLVGLGVSHPCLAFDRWPLLPAVDDDYNVVGAVRTYF
jgi:D-serine deaminase-like pyridoxal phosphate-dependent protein